MRHLRMQQPVVKAGQSVAKAATSWKVSIISTSKVAERPLIQVAVQACPRRCRPYESLPERPCLGCSSLTCIALRDSPEGTRICSLHSTSLCCISSVAVAERSGFATVSPLRAEAEGSAGHRDLKRPTQWDSALAPPRLHRPSSIVHRPCSSLFCFLSLKPNFCKGRTPAFPSPCSLHVHTRTPSHNGCSRRLGTHRHPRADL